MKKRSAFIFLLLIMGVGLFQSYRYIQKAPSSEEVYKTIEIESGATFTDVTALLEKEGLILSAFSFRLLGKVTQSESKIKPGEYLLHTAMRPAALLNALVRGDILTHRIVIPEGTASREIGAILAKSDILDAETFYQAAHDPVIIQKLGFNAKSLEGYLFPDTYYFAKKITVEKILQQMTQQFRNIYDDSFVKKAETLGMTQAEVITLASIIEKETGAAAERTTISGVFHNRLKRKMRLQSDPTVIFSLPDFDGDIRRKDLMYDSPYNTYRVKGLPPGPISNPGRESIYAALHPKQVDYIFFVAKNNGEHQFSVTLREHNRAVRKYQLKKKDEAMCHNCSEKKS